MGEPSSFFAEATGYSRHTDGGELRVVGPAQWHHVLGTTNASGRHCRCHSHIAVLLYAALFGAILDLRRTSHSRFALVDPWNHSGAEHAATVFSGCFCLGVDSVVS